MKKISFLALCLMALGTFGFVSSALAAQNAFTTNGTLTMGASPSGIVTIGLSPKVYGKYYNNGGNAAAAQWFAIATAHPGGNTIYGTSQDVNNIYKKGFTTGTTLDTTALAVQTLAGSEAAWTVTNGYSIN